MNAVTTLPTLPAAVTESDPLVLRTAREGDPEVRQHVGGMRPHKRVERWTHDMQPALAVAALSSFRV
ncbi:hypothetical protein ACFXJ8_23650 [Nonomuraea sp. NPDC059194]|uniref:hypothetical protein n=1 Tax=Nonomuraea sp. NPDC059194 TaxID=3346764 RepID=UPI00369D5907